MYRGARGTERTRSAGHGERQVRRPPVPGRLDGRPGRPAGSRRGRGTRVTMDASRARRRITWLEPAAAPPAAREVSAGAGFAPDLRFPDWKREGEFLFRRRQVFEGRAVGVWPEPFS